MIPRARHAPADLAVGATNRVAYLGWVGFANMGDEAVIQAVGQALPDVDLDPLPLGPRSVGGAVVRGDARRWSDCHLLVGGGTVLGRRIWRVHLMAGLVLARRQPLLMIGAGVEDPSFVRDHWLSERRELRWWPKLLRQFDRVTVRGPRSAELLAGIGVDAEVVGDPALLLAEPAARTAQGVVGINLGCSDDLWGHDQPGVVAVVAATVEQLVKRGWQPRFLVVNPSDRADADQCAARAGLQVGGYEIVDASKPAAFLSAIADCDALLCERLHAGVLGAAAGVPVVMLEYQPKCHDFMAAIDSAERSVRTDRLSTDACLEMLLATLDNGSQVAASQSAAVARLRRRLQQEAGRLIGIITKTDT